MVLRWQACTLILLLSSQFQEPLSYSCQSLSVMEFSVDYLILTVLISIKLDFVFFLFEEISS